MISDLLFRVAMLDSETDKPLDADAAVAAVIDTIDRDVSEDEVEEFAETVRMWEEHADE